MQIAGKTTRGRTYLLKAQCPAGHAYEGDNLGVARWRNGKVTRYCKACSRKRASERYRNMTPEQHERRRQVTRVWYAKRGGKAKVMAFYEKTKEKYRARKNAYAREYAKRPKAIATKKLWEHRNRDRRNELSRKRRTELMKDAAYRERYLRVRDKWLKGSPGGRAYYKRVLKWLRRWRKTEHGQLTVLRYSLGGKDVPESFLKTYFLYRQLKKELHK
jgi:hypothetical protein